ncbi:MAG: alpha/beta hydrolase family esterase [Nakamurella sp.]
MARSYSLYVPAKAAVTRPVPLLIVLHGGGGNGAHFEQVSGFDQVADGAGIIVAYPNAVRAPAGQVAAWNSGDCCGFAARTKIDDVGFIKGLIGALSSRYKIDPRRTYVAGYSNGGMLAYRIACQLAGTVAAIGVQSATLEFTPCRPSQPVSLVHIHGTADTHIPMVGGHGSGPSNADFAPPEQSAATIATADGCAATPAVSADPALAHAQLHSWSGCLTGIAVQFVSVTGATHAWMSTSAAQIWSFLAAHPRPA